MLKLVSSGMAPTKGGKQPSVQEALLQKAKKAKTAASDADGIAASGSADSQSGPSTPLGETAAGADMSKSEQVAMLNRLNYQAGTGKQEFQDALRLYKSLGHGGKSWFFQQYRRDKSCKWTNTYSNTTTAVTVNETETITGSLNRYEIGELNKIPSGVVGYEDMLDDLIEGLDVVKAHPKNSKLNTYDYSKELAKLKKEVDTNQEVFAHETDISKKNPCEDMF